MRTQKKVSCVFTAMSVTLATLTMTIPFGASAAEAAKAKAGVAKAETTAKDGAAKAEAAVLNATDKAAEVKPVAAEAEKQVDAVNALATSTSDFKGYGKTQGLLGPVTLGPTIGAALPHPMNVGLEGRYMDRFGFAFNYGFLPELKIPFGDAKAKLNSWDLRARWFPMRGAFFLGVALGRQTLTGVRNDQVLGESQESTLSADTNYLSPHLGWRWVAESGFVWGVDLGWQIAQSYSSTFTTTASATQQDAAEFLGLKKDLEGMGNDIAKTSLPFVTVLHVGFMM